MQEDRLGAATMPLVRQDNGGQAKVPHAPGGQKVRAACYLRYSDDAQKATSIDDQLRMCRETAARHGWSLSESLVFADDAISGQGQYTHKRTRYVAMREAIRAGEVDVLICDQQCRLARSARESLEFLDELGQHNVRLITADGFDSTARTAQLIYGIKSVFSEFFIDETRHRVVRSMQGEFERGSMVSALPYGYEIDVVRSNATGQCHWRFNEAEVAVLREMFRNRKNGMSLPQIAAELNGRGVPTSRQTKDGKTIYWRASAVWRILQNPIYKGLYQVRFGRKKGDEVRMCQRVMPELAVVSEYEWQTVQETGRKTQQTFDVQMEDDRKKRRGPYGGSKHPLD